MDRKRSSEEDNMATPEAERREHVFGGGKRGAVAVTVLYGAAAGGLAVAGREQLRKTASRAADTLGRDVQAAAEGVRQAN
jgi:hypothetical protein